MTPAASGAELPQRHQELQSLFHETKLQIVAIEREMEKDDLWQLVPHYVDGSFNEPHFPELTSDQIAKYRKLLGLVPYVSYVDKTNERTDFSLDSVTTDQWIFSFQFIHTAQRARPANCSEASIRGSSGACSSDLGDEWALWVTWFEPSNEQCE